MFRCTRASVCNRTTCWRWRALESCRRLRQRVGAEKGSDNNREKEHIATSLRLLQCCWFLYISMKVYSFNYHFRCQTKLDREWQCENTVCRERDLMPRWSSTKSTRQRTGGSDHCRRRRDWENTFLLLPRFETFFLFLFLIAMASNLLLSFWFPVKHYEVSRFDSTG